MLLAVGGLLGHRRALADHVQDKSVQKLTSVYPRFFLRTVLCQVNDPWQARVKVNIDRLVIC